MKNFDLEAAKRGAAVCTRNGKPVRIICWDMKWESGKMGDRIVYLADYNGDEHLSSCCINGAYHGKIKDSLDLMMRDDDYLEKLDRGEYGNHVEGSLEMVEPAVKENLTTDREYWRRVYAGQAITGLVCGLIINNYNGKIPIPKICAKGSIEIADALIEELEKTEK